MIHRKLNEIAATAVKIIIAVFDMALFPAGIVMLGIGLWLYMPWVSFAVIGAVLIIVSIMADMHRRGGKS